MLGLAILLIYLVGFMAKWRVFQKMGYNGWKSVIPLYSDFLLFKAVYGNGWVVLKLWLTPLAAWLAASISMAIGASTYSSFFLHILPIAIGLVAIIIIIRTLLKLYIDLAHAFNQKTSFGVGLILANGIFMILLGFSSYQYQDGSKSITESDVISTAAYKLDNWLRSIKKSSGKDTISLLKELGELHAEGVIDDEIYEKKKTDLLRRL